MYMRRSSGRSSSAFLAVAIVVTACGLGGCRIATEYVPQTPGRATIGVERGQVGVYKDGVFTALASGVPWSLACSPQAVMTATSAGEHSRGYRRNAAIASLGWGLTPVLPPLLLLGVAFGAISEADRAQSFALAVDAVNVHNDAGACILAAAPSAGGRP